MAKDEAKSDDQAEDQSEESGKKSGKLKLLALGLGGIALIAGSVMATLFFIGGDEEDLADAVAVEESPKAIYYAMNPEFRSSYVVNGRQRLFQVGLTLVTRDSDVIGAFNLHAPAIRNKVVIQLSGQSFENLQLLDGREALRQSLLSGIQEILKAEIGKEGVESVLFTQFVMQ